VIGSLSGDLILWDIEQRNLLGSIDTQHGQVLTTTFSPGGEVLTSGGNAIKLWRVPELELVASYQGSLPIVVFDITFSPDGGLIAAAVGYPNEEFAVIVLNATTLDLLTELRSRRGLFGRVAFSPDGTYLVAANTDGTIRLWGVPPASD
jgi:WD40 repeat protein